MDTDFNLNFILITYSGVLTGIIASTSVTSKEIENKSTIENTNFLLSLSITLGFYSTIGILVCTFLRLFGNINLINLFSVFILSYLTYLHFNKQIKKLKLPFFLDIILYLWSFLTYYISVNVLLNFYNFFKKENEDLYSFLFSILFLFIPLFFGFIKEKNKYSSNFKIPLRPASDSTSELLKNAHIDLIRKGYVDKNQRDEIIRKNVKDLSDKVDKLYKGTPEERKKILKEINDTVKDSNNNKKK